VHTSDYTKSTQTTSRQKRPSIMQTIPACLHAILHASNSFLYNSYSHLSLLKGGGGILIDHNDRNLLALTDDEEVYDDYIATTVDSGWMFFVIAVVISIASVVFLPLNIKVGKYFSSKLEAKKNARRSRRGTSEDNHHLSITNGESDLAIEPYYSASSAAATPPRTIWQRIQAAHSNIFLCIADYLIYRWGKNGRRRQHGRRERNARAREREARVSMMRIVAEEAVAAGRNGSSEHPFVDGEGGIELSVRRVTVATSSRLVPSDAVGVNHSQIELYQGGGSNKLSSSSCSSSIQNAFKFLMSIIRYDKETGRLLQLAIPFTFTAIVFTVADLIVLGFVSQYLGTDAMVAYALVDLTVGTTTELFGGFIEAVSSLGSMAYGADNYFAVGQYVQLAIVCYVLCQIPCFIVWGKFMKEIILLFGFDEIAAEMASKFVWVVMPLDIIEGIHESILDFLEVVEHEAYANILACIAAVTEVVLIWVGLHFYDADLVFIGLISLGNSAFFLVLNVMCCIGFGWLEKYENGLIRSLALRNRPLLKEFLKTSAPLAVGSMLAYAEWELLTVFAAVLGPAEAATWAVLGFVWDVFESTTEAFGDAGEVRVSYQLGKGRPQLARLSSYKSMFMGLAMSIVMSTIFLSLTNVLPEFLTTDQTIQDMLRMLFPMIALGNVTMSVGMVCWALVGAQLRYPLATAIATLCSFGITLPLGATFTIVLNYDLKGLTFAVIAGYVMTAMLLSTVLLMSDWEKLSERIREKVLADTVDEDSSSSDDSSSSSSSSSSSEGEEDDLQGKQLGGPLATKDVLADFDANSNMEDGGITHKKSEETDVSSVKAMHQAVQEDPNVTSPDRIINRVVTWWG